MEIKAVNKKREKKELSSYTKQQIVAYLFLSIPFLLVLIFKYIPIAIGVFMSFFDISIVELPGEFIGFDNYIRAFKDPKVWSGIWIFIKFYLYGLLMGFWPPIITALLINESRKLRPVFRIGYFIPAIAPGVAMTIVWKYVWQPEYGLANYVLSIFGIEPQLWLNDPELVFFAMAFPGLVVTGGMTMLYYLAAMQEVPAEHYEAATIDGAGFFKKTWYITLPAIKNIIGLMFLLNTVGIFNNLDGPLITTGGGPAGATETVLLYAWKQANNSMDYGYAVTLSTFVFVIVLVITIGKECLTKKEE